MFKKGRGPHTLRVQITFGLPAPHPPLSPLPSRRGPLRRGISCNPVWHGGLFSFSHVSLALERGSLHLRAAARLPAPRPLRTVRS